MKEKPIKPKSKTLTKIISLPILVSVIISCFVIVVQATYETFAQAKEVSQTEVPNPKDDAQKDSYENTAEEFKIYRKILPNNKEEFYIRESVLNKDADLGDMTYDTTLLNGYKYVNVEVVAEIMSKMKDSGKIYNSSLNESKEGKSLIEYLNKRKNMKDVSVIFTNVEFILTLLLAILFIFHTITPVKIIDKAFNGIAVFAITILIIFICYMGICTNEINKFLIH